MGSSLYYRRYVEKMIAVNPAEIVIKRTVMNDDGFGGTTTEDVTLPAQVVSLYNRRAVRETVNDAGQTIGYHAQRATKLLAAWDADLVDGDQFTHGGRTWRVLDPIDYLGACRQAELEVVR